MNLKLQTRGSTFLKQVAEPVDRTEDMHELVANMCHLMLKGKGIGIAANQVGVLKRVIVIHNNGFTQEFINPVIRPFGGKISCTEGCLSYPGVQKKMIRHKSVMITGFDVDWNPIKRKLNNLNAAIAQHEVDHLNGRTIG